MIDKEWLKSFNFNIDKKYLAPAVSVGVVAFVFGLAMTTVPNVDDIEMRVANAEAVETEPVKITMLEDKQKDVFNVEWRTLDFANPTEYNDALISAREDAVGIADVVIEEYESVITDEQRELLKSYEQSMTSAGTFAVYNDALEKFGAVVAECEAKMPKPVYSGGGSYSGGNVGDRLTSWGGVFKFGEYTEKYYNLNMSQVVENAKKAGIEGDYWVRDDGVKMYGDYVIVASQHHNKGDTIETSLGQGIVIDYCETAGVVDIATAWG